MPIIVERIHFRKTKMLELFYWIFSMKDQNTFPMACFAHIYQGCQYLLTALCISHSEAYIGQALVWLLSTLSDSVDVHSQEALWPVWWPCFPDSLPDSWTAGWWAGRSEDSSWRAIARLASRSLSYAQLWGTTRKNLFILMINSDLLWCIAWSFMRLNS